METVRPAPVDALLDFHTQAYLRALQRWDPDASRSSAVVGSDSDEDEAWGTGEYRDHFHDDTPAFPG